MKPADPRIVQLIRPGSAGNIATPTTAPSNTGTKPKPPLTTERKGPKKRSKGERVDWDGMEPHYRANSLSLRELGEMFGVTAAAILKHARIQDPPWTRDLTDVIIARADDLVNAAVVNAVNDGPDLVNGKPRLMTKAVVVQATAEIIANVRLGQRERFSQMAALSTEMFIAIRDQFANRVTLETLGQLMDQSTPDNVDKLNDIYMQAIALPGQIKAFKDLSDIITKLTDMESKAYKLDKAPEGGDQSRTSLPIRFVEAAPLQLEVDDDDE